MSRLPRFVANRNRRNGYAEEQASGYNFDPKPCYLLDSGDGQGAQPVDLRELMRRIDFTPGERRRMRELQIGQTAVLDGGRFVLHCVEPQETAVQP